MELDDFRRGWQQPTAAEAPAALNTRALTRLLARRSNNPIAKMRRNVWLEAGSMVVLLILCGTALVYAQDPHSRAMSSWLIVMCLLSGVYYRRKLLVLRDLSDVSGALHEHVVRQLGSMRALIRLYYRATLWSLPIYFGIGMVFLGQRIISDVSGQRLMVSLSILVVVYAVLGGLTYFLMRWYMRWWIQRLYGQHLDRLEALLRELEAE